MKPSKFLPVLTVLGTLAFATSFVQASTLLTDNFTGPNGSLVSENPPNMDVGRQTGSLAEKGWLDTESAATINTNQMRISDIGTGTSSVALNHNFTDSAITSGGGFTVQFDLKYNYIQSTDWILFSVGGGNSTSVNTDYSGLAGNTSGTLFTYSLRHQGYAQLYAKGVAVTTNGQPDTYMKSGGAETITTSDVFTWRFTYEGTSFATGSTWTTYAEVSKNGGAYFQMDLNNADPLTKGRSTTVDATRSNLNTIYFTALNNTTTGASMYNVDNLVISAIPEPASWALLAGSLTALMAFRRRRNS